MGGGGGAHHCYHVLFFLHAIQLQATGTIPTPTYLHPTLPLPTLQSKKLTASCPLIILNGLSLKKKLEVEVLMMPLRF